MKPTILESENLLLLSIVKINVLKIRSHFKKIILTKIHFQLREINIQGVQKNSSKTSGRDSAHENQMKSSNKHTSKKASFSVWRLFFFFLRKTSILRMDVEIFIKFSTHALNYIIYYLNKKVSKFYLENVQNGGHLTFLIVE